MVAEPEQERCGACDAVWWEGMGFIYKGETQYVSPAGGAVVSFLLDCTHLGITGILSWRRQLKFAECEDGRNLAASKG